MKTLIFLMIAISSSVAVFAQSPVGNWKMLSHMSSYDGKSFDSHAALLTQRPCAAKIIYRITSDGNYRLDASASGCDEKYVNIQQRLYSKNVWKMDGTKLFIGGKEGIGNTYVVSFPGNKMIWKSEYGDVITYQKL